MLFKEAKQYLYESGYVLTEQSIKKLKPYFEGKPSYILIYDPWVGDGEDEYYDYEDEIDDDSITEIMNYIRKSVKAAGYRFFGNGNDGAGAMLDDENFVRFTLGYNKKTGKFGVFVGLGNDEYLDTTATYYGDVEDIPVMIDKLKQYL